MTGKPVNLPQPYSVTLRAEAWFLRFGLQKMLTKSLDYYLPWTTRQEVILHIKNVT